MKFAEVYWTLVQAGRRTEQSIPAELRTAYEAIKAAQLPTTHAGETTAI